MERLLEHESTLHTHTTRNSRRPGLRVGRDASVSGGARLALAADEQES